MSYSLEKVLPYLYDNSHNSLYLADSIGNDDEQEILENEWYNLMMSKRSTSTKLTIPAFTRNGTTFAAKVFKLDVEVSESKLNDAYEGKTYYTINKTVVDNDTNEEFSLTLSFYAATDTSLTNFHIRKEASNNINDEKIYGASRASEPKRVEMWKSLRQRGVNIISSWIDKVGTPVKYDELWTIVAKEIQEADKVVLYVEMEDFPMKGALVEIGMALALGKEVVIVCPGVEINQEDFRPLGSWINHPLVSFEDNIEKAVF